VTSIKKPRTPVSVSPLWFAYFSRNVAENESLVGRICSRSSLAQQTLARFSVLEPHGSFPA
jgi:hypothetical protein